MAERRMFAKTIVISDEFLDMSATARCLYFTLSMFADDDGFVNNPKSIMRQSGASENDMAELVSKKYVLLFNGGILVIKHWRIHNYLRNDRYTETKYVDIKKTLYLDENKAYTGNKKAAKYTVYGDPLTDTNGIPSGRQAVYQTDTNGIPSGRQAVSTGKDSIGKDSIGKDSERKKEIDINIISNSACACDGQSDKTLTYENIISHYAGDIDAETRAAIWKYIQYFQAKTGLFILNEQLKVFLRNLKNNGLLFEGAVLGCLNNDGIGMAMMELNDYDSVHGEENQGNK